MRRLSMTKRIKALKEHTVQGTKSDPHTHKYTLTHVHTHNLDGIEKATYLSLWMDRNMTPV